MATRAVVQDIPPTSLSVLRFGQGACILWIALLLKGMSKDGEQVRKRDLLYLAMLGGIFFAASPWTFNAGLKLTEASQGALMVATFPVWSILFGRISGQERLGRRQLGGVLLSVAGVSYVLVDKGLHWQVDALGLLGDGLMLGSAALGAVHGVLVQNMYSRYRPLSVTAWEMLFGTVLLLPFVLLDRLPQIVDRFQLVTLALVLFLGVLGGSVAYLLWNSALVWLKPTQVAIYLNVTPLVALVLAATFLSERLTVRVMLGFTAVVIGVTLVNWPRVSKQAQRGRA